MNKTIEFEDTSVRIYGFDNGTEVSEFHVIISVKNPFLTYTEQLTSVMEAFSSIRKTELEGAETVFKRYFLSDAANQSDELMNWELETPNCALSVIQQGPLNGTKIALWAYLLTEVTRCLDSETWPKTVETV